MTAQEVEASLAGLAKHIENYAELAVRKGVAIQPGQELVVSGPVERADFVRLVVRKGYEAGAGHVTVLWYDDDCKRTEYEYMDVDFYKTVPSWKREQLNSLAEAGAAFLMIIGSDPYAMAGIDPAKSSTASRATSEQCKSYRNGLDFGRNAWSILGAPVEKWARCVFPDVDPREAVLHLWEKILFVSRADGADPQAEWELHNATFEKNKRILNGYAFDKLRYQSSNGTDFELGLNQGHIWMGGASRTVDDTVFFPNIPTEEVFTSPDRLRAKGVVHSALPLVRAGQVVRDFWLRFDEGRVVEYDAAEGREVLKSIIETDENSCRLGECALVAKDTPIRESGILYFDTLYDENASCHLALGTGFPECLEGGLDMDEEALLARGVNQSHTHVDFMIGSDDLNITGITQTGEEVPIFVDGRWSWSV
ncbi:MAG: aminopeptidase [Coriobacteriales bacterium]|nr:aminopeptidase [Coriobacteriales bacterium]